MTIKKFESDLIFQANLNDKNPAQNLRETKKTHQGYDEKFQIDFVYSFVFGSKYLLLTQN